MSNIGEIKLLCGGRNNGKTLQQYLEIQKWAIENDYEKVKVEFINSDTIKIQELIKYLKERINLCDKYIKIHKEELSGVVNVSENNRHLILIKNLTIKKEIYEEILSKIEKSDNNAM